jgi:hypothetical protein
VSLFSLLTAIPSKNCFYLVKKEKKNEFHPESFYSGKQPVHQLIIVHSIGYSGIPRIWLNSILSRCGQFLDQLWAALQHLPHPTFARVHLLFI